MWLKNKLFDNQVFKSYYPEIFTITVGNLAVGGTGKTPMVEFLANLFLEKYRIAILSRGYGRTTKGFFQISEASTANKVGDEPLQYFRKFKQKVNVFVGENRVEAFQKLKQIEAKTNLLLLDDAFQHRAIQAHLNIVLSDYNNLIYNDLMLPLGQLREPISSLSRAQILIITKCPSDLTLSEANEIKSRFLKCCPDIQIYFTKIINSKYIQFSGKNGEMPSEIILVAGIAKPNSFIKYCEENWTLVEKHLYKDHHIYNQNDINKITKNMSENRAILTTEKDFVKLSVLVPPNNLAYYLPIETEFLFDQLPAFTQLIEIKINNFYKNKLAINL